MHVAASRRKAAVVPLLGVCALIGIGLTVAGDPVAAVLVAIAIAVGASVVTQRGIRSLLVLTMTAAGFTAPMNGLRVGKVLTVSDLFLISASVLVATIALLQYGLGSLELYKPFIFGAVLILLGGCIGAAASPYGSPGFGEGIKLFSASVVLLVVVAMWGPTSAQSRLVAWAFCAGAALSAVLGVLLLRTGIQERAIGLTTHPNHLGIVSLLAFGTAVGLALHSGRVGRKVGAGLAVVLAGGLLASGSRAAVFGAFISFWAFLLISRNRAILRWAALVSAVCAVLLALGFIQISSSSAVGRIMGQDATAADSDVARSVAREDALDIIKAKPITGVGFGVVKEAHNVYLQFAAASGLLGLSGAACIVLATSRLARRRWRANVLGPAMLCSYIGYLGAGLFSNVIADRYLWLHLAITIALYSEARLVPDDARPGLPRALTPSTGSPVPG